MLTRRETLKSVIAAGWPVTTLIWRALVHRHGHITDSAIGVHRAGRPGCFVQP